MNIPATYPVGTPGVAWGVAEKAEWRARQHKLRSYADEVVAKVAGQHITERRFERGHALDQEGFDSIIDWIVDRAS